MLDESHYDFTMPKMIDWRKCGIYDSDIESSLSYMRKALYGLTKYVGITDLEKASMDQIITARYRILKMRRSICQFKPWAAEGRNSAELQELEERRDVRATAQMH